MISRKEEDDNNNGRNEKGLSSNPPSSSSWSRSRDPRVVRVSRAFGGKDRHSKVCTIKGLRDRRVRLSVPTAIQLYDLQERLGLNQPSKVVDWLLDVAKNEIDELPPLRLMTSDGNQIIDQNLVIRSIIASQSSGKQVESNPWISDTLLMNKSKVDVALERESTVIDDDEHEQLQVFRDSGVSLMNNSSSEQQFMRWDSSSLSLAHEDIHHHQSFNVLPLMTSPETQVLVYHHHHQQQQPSAASATTAISQSYFASSSNNNNNNNLATTSADPSDNYNVPKQFNFHMLDSNSSQNHHQFSNPRDRRF